MRNAVAIVAAVLVLGTVACRTARERDLGTGLNTVDKRYPKPVGEAWDAALAAVKEHDLKIETERHDSLGGEIVATRGNTDDKVTVRVKAVDSGNTDVSVRVDPGDRNMAEMIHGKISQELGTPPAE